MSVSSQDGTPQDGPAAAPESVVVVGGGLAGVSVAGDLRRLGFAGAITILDAGDVLHDRPPLSKEYLLGVIDDEGLRLRPPQWYDEQAIEVRHGVSALRAVPEQGYVELTGGERIAAGCVVLATGGTARRLPVPGADSPRVHDLRTVEDARALREHLAEGRRVLVVGGGLIGAELASTARKLGAQVTLVDPVLPLANIVGGDVATWLHARHAQEGVTVHGSGVEHLEDRGDEIRAHLTSGVDIVADAVVVGIGLVPETALAERSGARVDGGVVVGRDQRTSVPGLFAVGDCTRPAGDDGELLPRVEHWEGAMHGAARAAAAIVGAPVPAEQAQWFWSDRHGNHVEVVGDLHVGGRGTHGVAPTGQVERVVRGKVCRPPFAIFAVAGDRLVGAVSVDDPKAIRAARRLIDGHVPVDAAELADPEVDLRKLARRSTES